MTAGAVLLPVAISSVPLPVEGDAEVGFAGRASPFWFGGVTAVLVLCEGTALLDVAS